MKVWGVASEDVGSRGRFLLLQNLHSHHPWRLAAVACKTLFYKTTIPNHKIKDLEVSMGMDIVLSFC